MSLTLGRRGILPRPLGAGDILYRPVQSCMDNDGGAGCPAYREEG